MEIEIGDVVMFYPANNDALFETSRPGVAIVVGFVELPGTRLANLVVFTDDGVMDRRTMVQIGDRLGRPYCAPRKKSADADVASQFAAWAGV